MKEFFELSLWEISHYWHGYKPKSGDTTEEHYKVRTISRLRDKHIEIERWILDQAGIEQPKLDESPSLLTLVK